MVKEKIKYNDGTEVELDVFHLGFRKASLIAEDYYPIDKITKHANKDESMSGHFQVHTAKRVAIESIKGLDLDKMKASEATRLYKKYFEAEILGEAGKNANPN